MGVVKLLHNRTAYVSRVGRVDCCWSSSARSFLISNPVELVIIFYCLTTPGDVQHSESLRPVQQIAAGPR
jgi:hypothetical protein